MRGERIKEEHRESVKPPPELEALDYFVGSWSCANHLEAGPDGPERDTKGKMICRWELGKFHLGVAEDDELRLAQPRRRQSRAFWSYNDSELAIRVDVAGPDGELVRRLEQTCRRDREA